MGFKIGGVTVLVASECGTFDNEPEGPGHACVHIFHGQASFFDCLDQSIVAGVGPRLNEVVAGMYLGCGVIASAPVGHDSPLEAPVVPQYVGQQPRGFRCVCAVDVVIRGHKRPGLGLSYGDFESPQIDFPHGALAHASVVVQAVELLVVEGEVLDRGADSVGLYAVNVGGSNLAGQHRVF